jgi:hypothetical protein
MIFGLAYTIGWALGGFLNLGDAGAYFFEAAFMLLALIGMLAFLKSAVAAEPIVERRN